MKLHTHEFLLDESDWKENIRGWICPALGISNSKLIGLYSNGKKIDQSLYSIDEDTKTISWKGKYKLNEIIALIETNQTLDESSKELSSKWKKFAIITPIVVVILSFSIPYLIESNKSDDYLAWGELSGEDAIKSFMNGKEIPDLEGIWEVKLFEDSLGYQTDYKVREAGRTKKYPGELVICKVKNSVISFQTEHENAESAKMWAEGRINDDGIATLIMWSEVGTPQSEIVSVNILKLEILESPNSYALRGRRIGTKRNGDFELGFIEYIKK